MSQSVENRKGEVHEIRALMRNPKMRDPSKFRSVIEKVVAYMTLGIDVSSLFSDMIMATNTKDPVQKKMVYLYLCNYAEQNSELALLTINTLQKDAQDDDPMIRGLALRSLCGLRIPNLIEYIVIPIRRGLSDPSAYVRKTAVLAVAKLYGIDHAALNNTDFVDQLYNMLRDLDPEVIINAIYALNEILADEGGMAVNKKIVYHLINKLKDFHEWGQCVVLDLLNKYTPQDSEEIFDILNILEDRLRHSNSAVILATNKLFLNLTKDFPKVHIDVYKRLKSPLLTLIGSSIIESSYIILCHIAVLVRRCRGIFDDAFKNFYIRYNDPLCVKTLKLLILGEICNPDNASEILLELSEYVTSIDIEVARNAVKTTGKIALQVESCVSEAIEYLISFVDLNVDYLTSETCIAIKDLLRKYPDRHYDVLPAIHKSLKTIEEPVGKVAVIWMIGEYGDVIEDAPYILEPILENFNEESSSSVKLEILTAAMKLFFKRPPEVHKMLGVLLASAIDTSSEPDVRDRALLYYRLLKYDAHEAARVVNGQKVAVDILLDSDEQEINDRLFEEFNTLSVIYRKPSEQFVNIPTCLEEEEESEDENDKSESIYESDAKLLQLKETYDEDTASIDSKQSQDSKILLSATPQCDAMTFQSKWAQLPSTAVLEINLPDLNAVKSVEQIFLGKYFFVIASGTVNQVTKFYFFAQEQKTDDLFFAEVIVDHQSLSLRATFKGENPSSTKILSDDLSEFLTSRRQNQ